MTLKEDMDELEATTWAVLRLVWQIVKAAWRKEL